MKSLLLLIISFYCVINTCLAQFSPGPSIAGTIIRKNKKKNAKEEKSQIANADSLVQLAEASYSKGDIEQAKKYLDESEEKGRVTGKFYSLLGQYYFDKKQYKYAKRYWTKGVEKKKSEECEKNLKQNEVLLKDF